MHFGCGGFVRISMAIDDDGGFVAGAAFRSNGCGFMVAATETACRDLVGKPLAELRALNDLRERIVGELGPPPADREECILAVVEAFRDAFREHRNARVEEFSGERALICTCFGISEDTIAGFIETWKPETVDEVSASTRAGSGCGSCRMLIQDLLDAAAWR